ncbi:hypothetical protein [Alteromonas sp. KUL49]|uniref:hypothetical protein n=1 Tax=Alteromonas sp. KUL49 TaxID=2480798 RepID=UPI00102F2363|nr:hypothetical protein [Alteromonas sp. KUL49]TAP40936.1 hypothetical protein EYS00_07470 [Alteromonas sp. KUL49]GEA11118.1 hypothetical protein KUL49_14930 [Alteromonas sp. KUL49]
MAFYSIGCSCLPKFGIRTSGDTGTNFFDWLITDVNALEKSLVGFSEEQFLNNGVEVCDNELRVKDLYTGLRFQHDFPVFSNDKIDPSKIDGAISEIREKYIRRRNRLFEEFHNDNSPTLIRYEWEIANGDEGREETYARRIKDVIDASLGKDYNLIVISNDILSNRVKENTLFFKS